MTPQDPNPGALVAGVLFIVLGVLFLLDHVGSVHLDMRWVWPFLPRAADRR